MYVNSVLLALPEMLAVPVLAVAAWRDIKTAKVENLFSYLIVALSCASCVILAAEKETVLGLMLKICGILPPAVLIIPWLKGKIGGADVKISLPLGLLWGLENIIVLLAVCFISAGVFVLIKFCLFKAFRQDPEGVPLLPFLLLGHMWVLFALIL